MNEFTLRLLLVERDLVFRLGLRTWLAEFPDLEVAAEASSPEAALDLLARQDERHSFDLVVLATGLGRLEGSGLSGLEFCRTLKQDYPDLPVLLLEAGSEPVLVAAALRYGVEGCCDRMASTGELLTAIRRLLEGGRYLGDRYAGLLVGPLVDANRDEVVSTLSVLRHNLRLVGLQEIDRALSGVEALLSEQDLSPIERWVLAGRQRELLVARWLVGRVLLPDGRIHPWRDRGRAGMRRSPTTQLTRERMPIAIVPSDAATLERLDILLSTLTTAIAAKLQLPLENFTTVPLEIDILKPEKKRELLAIAIARFAAAVRELQAAPIAAEQIPLRQQELLLQVWEETATAFFGRYATLPARDRQPPVEILPAILADSATVAAEMLDSIPLVSSLLSYLLFQTPLTVDNASYAAGTVEATARSQLLLENLIVQIACAVMQPLLNHFGDVEAIKQQYYDYHRIATREIERFRNDLSWRYRSERFFHEPKAIFESRYRLFALGERGIRQVNVYAPRTEELNALRGVRLCVTLLLELQDAIAPRLRSALAFVGSGLVYLLTNVVGRGIGLIGRGILQGIGSAWRDSTPPKAKAPYRFR